MSKNEHRISRRQVIVTASAGIATGLAGCWAASDTEQPNEGCRDTRGQRVIDQRSAIEKLRQPPFPPTDIDLFATEIYEDSTTMFPASWRPMSESRIQSQMRNLLTRRFRGDPDRIRPPLALFDDPDFIHTIPNPRLRAGTVAMAGTLAHPAFEAVRDGALEQMRFETFAPEHGDAIALVRHPHGQDHVAINNKYRFEDFRLFSPTIFHEILHEDLHKSSTEELIIHSLDSLLRGQLVLEMPDLVANGTELTRWMNTVLLARLNSRDEQGELRIFESNGEIFPDGRSAETYADITVGEPGHDTPGNKVLEQVLEAVTNRLVTTPRYDDATLVRLDENQELLTPVELVCIAKTLKLDIT